MKKIELCKELILLSIKKCSLDFKLFWYKDFIFICMIDFELICRINFILILR